MPNKTEMNCSDVEPLLFDYSDGVLPEPVKNRISRHLTACTSCSEIHHSVLGINRVIAHEKAISPNPFLSTRLLQHIESGIERQQHDLIFKIKPVFQPLLITLGLLLALFTGVMLGHRETGTNQSVITENSRVDELKTELLINQFVEEDQTLFLNN